MYRIVTAAALGLALVSPLAVSASPKGCPPGLAKKSPACVPPGQAAKQPTANHRYDRGDRLTGDYVRIGDPARYGLDPDRSYYRVGDQVYRVDEDTREVLAVIGALAALAD